MTHRLTLFLFIILFCCFAVNIAAASQVDEPRDAAEEFDLSEPDVDDKATNKISTQSRPPRTPQAHRESHRQTTRPQSSQPQLMRSSESVTFELLESDGPPEPFFSGAVPRRMAIINDASLNDVSNVGPLIWAVGERGIICFSNDGGTTWTSRITPFECSLKTVCFLTNTIGWVAGHRTRTGTMTQQSAVLLHTRDGGKTWTDLTAKSVTNFNSSSHFPATALPGIIHIQFFGLDSAIAVTSPMRNRSGHAIFRSDDGGHTWSPIASDQSGGPWLAGQFLSESDGIVAGQHQSYAAVVADQAVVINRPEPTLRAIRSVSLDPTAHGWIAGDGGFLLKTDDAGVTWKQPVGQMPRELNEMLDFHAIAHNNATILLGGNPGTTLLHSANNGEDWKRVSLPLTGCLNRLRFLNETEVIGVGSLGQIVRSSDSGKTWYSVRSTNYRVGVMNMITDADKAAWHLLSGVSAELGVRSVVVQISQPLSLGSDALRDGVPMSETCTAAVTRLGGNDTSSHWMFPRTKPEHHRSSDQLVTEWNRQTDGQLSKLLPLRIARDIRNWRPSVLVIEPASDDDAIAAILRDVIPLAISLAAAADEADGRQLSQLGLSPWNVDRVVSRVLNGQTETVTFRDDDLLPSLGTTSGLLHDATLKLFEQSVKALPAPDAAAGYELLLDSKNSASIAGLFEGLNNALQSDARRPYDFRSKEQVDILKSTLQAAHIESTALTGHMQSAQTEDALIAQLYGLGANLPATLALKQLRDLADINLQQNNMEGYLAVQQEIVRRYPTFEEAQAAAEMLFLFYSSSEARHYRLGTSQRKITSDQTTATALQPTPFAPQNTSTSPFSVQPMVQAVTSSPFASGATNALEALHQRWDSHAMTAMNVLSGANPGGSSLTFNPLVHLRIAANYRLQGKSGEQSTTLSELSQRDDQYGLFARCEMQVNNMPAAPVLPLINLPQRSEPPFLDGVLTDSIWEDAEEILLTPFVRDSLDAATGVRRKQLLRGADVSSLTMLAWDDEFLYLAARLQRAPEKSQPIELATHRSYDAKHANRDRLELEIDTDRDFGTSFQLTVDETGDTSDSCWMLDKWNPKWFVAMDADADTWRIEAAIPLKELSAVGAKPGDLWNIRLRRIIPGVLQHELQTGTNAVSTDGTGMVRFIRPRRTTTSRRR